MPPVVDARADGLFITLYAFFYQILNSQSILNRITLVGAISNMVLSLSRTTSCVRDKLFMFYCPRCKAAVPADALFCYTCGYNQTNARMAALPKTPPGADTISAPTNMTPSQTLPPAQQLSQTPIPPVQPRAFRLSLPSTPRTPSQSFTRPVAPTQPQFESQPSQPGQNFPPPVVAPMLQSLPSTPAKASQQNMAPTQTIDRPEAKQTGQLTINLYWLAIALMACLMIGLGAFIFSTYQTSTAASNSAGSYTPNFAPPSLSAPDWRDVAIQQGSTLHLHGDNFDIGDPIIFLIDGSTSISGSNGREVAIQVSNQGTFDVAVPVPTSWSVGPHIIEAEDNKTGQTAYLTIQVST